MSPGAFSAEDRGAYSAALFSLDGDVRAIELPGRGHDVALSPDGGEWVTFARRPGRFGVAIPVGTRPPVWFASKSDRHFFGHGVFSAAGRLLYATENDYERAAGVIGVRDATVSTGRSVSSPPMAWSLTTSRSCRTAAPW